MSGIARAKETVRSGPEEEFFQGCRIMGPEKELVKYGVVGSATFQDYQLLCDTLDGYGVTNVTTGDSIGAQSLAVRYANERGYDLKMIWTNIKSYGAGARFMRNHLIAEWSDVVIVFWDGESRGTRQTIKMTKEMGLPVKVVLFRSKGNPSKRAAAATEIFAIPEEISGKKIEASKQRDIRP